MTSIVWFRRDLRVADQPTFLAAAGEPALAVLVLDPVLLANAGAARLGFLSGCLAELNAQLGGRLLVTQGDPVEVLPDLARRVGARSVHIAADYGPYGAERDRSVDEALGDGELVRTGSPYAVAPGRVLTGSGGRYKVFTPFRRAWAAHGWRAPAVTSAATVSWLDPAGLPSAPFPDVPSLDLPEPGERAALRYWRAFRDEHADSYETGRNRPDWDATSRMSPYLKFGCIHPRTMLADLASEAYVTELAWREFYADVLARRPETAWRNYDPAFDALPVAADDSSFAAWCEGRTGYPIVDAGMRQLRAEAWMHNRVRMITASFLVKDLHLPWQLGARHFMRLLVDGDLASNQHGWQWVAGCGTDAAPYHRVFNPTVQGERFDPNGDYVRRYVPELARIPGKSVHQPWRLPAEQRSGYPDRIVDHDEARRETLARYETVKSLRAMNSPN